MNSECVENERIDSPNLGNLITSPLSVIKNSLLKNYYRRYKIVSDYTYIVRNYAISDNFTITGTRYPDIRYNIMDTSNTYSQRRQSNIAAYDNKVNICNDSVAV